MPAPSNQATSANREIVLTRSFDAPRETVFDAWTDPQQVVQWWGPRGFTTTSQEIDVRPGGAWRFIMHGPDGTDYYNEITFVEVLRPERLVYNHRGEEGSAAFQTTVTFEAEGGRTKVTMKTVFATAADRDFVVREYDAIEGGNQTLDRLGDHVAMKSAEAFVISRTFDAPRELVWKL